MVVGASDELAEQVLSGDRRAVARVITLLERGDDRSKGIMKELYPHTGRAQVLGITGAAGTGKSTLVDRLIESYRALDKRVGVLVVDPSSPFTGGAFLGDRLRMQRHTRDDGVFIRSMASRGYLGGLSRATWEAVRVLDAVGMDIVLVETLGTGQDEIDVIQIAPTCVLVVTPGMGDEIQALKGGLMEIGHIIVVNKSDLDGHVQALRGIEGALAIKEWSDEDWRPTIVSTTATDGVGIDELVDSIQGHHDHLHESAAIDAALTQRATHELGLVFKDELQRIVFRGIKGTGKRQAYIRQIVDGERDPYSIIDEVMEEYLKVRPADDD
jgi:LAO/AO transport system kinase